MSTDSKTPSSEPWKKIDSFEETSLPVFPTHTLPTVLRDWVKAESHSLQTPEDMAGLLTVAVCAATVAGRVRVEPRPDWCEPVNLFVAVLMESGNRKSPIFKDALEPIRAVEAALIAESRDVIAREQSFRRRSKLRLDRLEKAASVDPEDTDLREQADNLASELARQPEPVTPRLIIDDATAEKVVTVLSEQQGRIASMSPEGGVFDLMKGMYSKNGGPQFDVYLKGYSGDDLVTDRITRESVRVPRPALTCAYAIQPEVIKGLGTHKAFRDRGLLARFLYAVPKSLIGERELGTTPVPKDVREAYHEKVQALAATDSDVVLGLDPDAEARFDQWEQEVEHMLGDGGELELIQDWGAKLLGTTLRLAGVLHSVEHGPDGHINEVTISNAIEIAQYLIPHADYTLRVMHARTDASHENALYLLRWIKRGNRQRFTKRDAHQHGRRRFPRADDLDPVLKHLEKRGYIRPAAAQKPRAGRPSQLYEVNPDVFVGQVSEKRTQYTQNQNADNETGGFEDIEDGFRVHPQQAVRTLGQSEGPVSLPPDGAAVGPE